MPLLRLQHCSSASKGIEDILIIYISYFGDTDENGQRKAFEL